VLGSVRHPTNTSDYGSFLLRAQASGAKVVALADSGTDFVQAVKQARVFDLLSSGQKVAAMAVTLSDIKALGLETAQGMLHTEAVYWDLNDESRKFARRFMERRDGIAPSQAQAGSYSAVLNYLRAIKETGTDDTAKVLAQMKSVTFSDAFTPKGRIHPRERHIARAGRYADAAELLQPAAGGTEADGVEHPQRRPSSEARRGARGDYDARAVPCRRRIVLYHRRRVHNRRRQGGALTSRQGAAFRRGPGFATANSRRIAC
jgi:hypothetical protein